MSDSAHPSEQNQPLINWQAALEHAGGDKSLLDELIGLFFDEAPKYVAEARQSLDSGDAKVLQRAGHTLKGMLRIFESAEARELASQLEQMGVSGEASRGSEVLARLEKQLELVIAELKKGSPS